MIPVLAGAQTWSGIIDPTRAMDWSQAGIPGGLPDAGWTQCGATIAAYTGTASTINNALAACGTNQYVLLGPGTFNLSTSIDFKAKSHVVLRGSGANSTFLVFSGSSAMANCGSSATTLIGICGHLSDYWSSPTVYTWTAGYAQGSNSITLSGTSGIATAGSGNPSLLFLNQDDDGYTGYPASGSAVDNGGYFVCADQYTATPSVTGCSVDGPDGTLPSPFTHRWQQDIGVATAVNSGTGVVTLAQPLKHPNWRSGQSPTAIILVTSSVVSSGVENLSIDMGSNSGFNYGIMFAGAYQCWVSGVRIMNESKWAIGAGYSSHLQIQNNYLCNGPEDPAADPYGIRFYDTADNLIVNNIIQKIRAPLVFDSPDVGSVIAYNFAVNDYYASDAMFPAYWDHSTGDDFHLWEGNIGAGSGIDNYHGTHLDETTFRNFLTGWESCANGQCGATTLKDFGTAALGYSGYNRYGNIIGNVLGTPGYTNIYQTATFGGNGSAYYLGVGNSGIPTDPLTASTSLRWGNYDVVTGAVRWCGNSADTGWSTTCASTSEVPTSAPSYPNSVPTKGDIGAGQSALPASFYLSSKPSWFGSLPWPPIGPDVSGGNIGICSGTLNTAGEFAGVPATSSSQCTGTSLAAGWAGHVNTNPAMNCYLNVMSGPPDGTGSALSFNAATCYGSGSGAQPPSPPRGLRLR
jgi:hypothetical protein